MIAGPTGERREAQRGTGILIYLVIGEGRHLAEAIFSIYSARWQERAASAKVRIVVYADRPLELPDELEADLRLIEADELEAWTGDGFFYRAKLRVLEDALSTQVVECVLIDSDTYFKRAPGVLFGRVAAGKSLLHIKEKAMGGIGNWASFVGARYVDASGHSGIVAAADPMWNAGVVAVPLSDRQVLDDVMAAHDSLVEQGYPPISEQVALSQILWKRTVLVAAADTVFHYWGESFRQRWATALERILAEAMLLQPAERAGYLYARRPRLSYRQHLRHLVKRPLQRVGLVRPSEGSSHHTLPPALPREPRPPRRP